MVLIGHVTTDESLSGAGVVMLPCRVVIANGACEVTAVGDPNVRYHFSGAPGAVDMTAAPMPGFSVG